MIVTRKHLHRRTFLKGMGAAVALPMLDAMTPALAAARPGREGAGPHGVHLRAQRHRHGRLDADGRGTRLRVLAHPEAAREVPRGHARALWARAPERLCARRRTWRPRARGGVVPDRRAPEEDRRRRHPERHLRRPDRGAAPGRGDALRLARNRVRRLAHGRQLRLRLLLRVHQQPGVARTGDADAAGDEPAPGLRAAVRRHRHQPRPGGPRAPAAAIAAASSTSSASARRSSRPVSDRPTSGSSTSTCRPSARSSSASSGPRRT